eukprot:CAMPEP_0181228006 /NCGR_PEP_ID=MMETSP1096-20121128/33108_1 /TAXON_ID=156174 ORGANISM="Chrysochromulina ericina, Strain CCMP281" /NCGR_SAMPLE_ID=MMETSP1096 /ASSEMBLY_ACC=CAM_ASM_000453 /LENGTH=180 /DNA_ID=CAMNT_0023321483 /DNA_START=417 /DNA_END=958 /DNA_ORIENTATION=-
MYVCAKRVGILKPGLKPVCRAIVSYRVLVTQLIGAAQRPATYAMLALTGGFLVLEWVDGMPFVLELIVKPNKRHRGTGADLVHEAKKMAKQPLHLIARSGVPVLRAAWLHDPMLLKQTRLRAEGRRGVHDGQPRQAKLPAEAAEAPSRRQRTSRLHMRVRYLSGRRLSDVTRVYLYLVVS